MNILLVLIPISLLLIGIAVWAFFWAVDRGQFDDLETPALRILEDDPPRLARRCESADDRTAALHDAAEHGHQSPRDDATPHIGTGTGTGKHGLHGLHGLHGCDHTH